VELGRISGEVDWQQQTLAVPSGTQTLLWIYSKDGSASAGQDAAWLDQVSYTGGGTPLVITQPARGQNSFSASVFTAGGKNYTLEYKDALSASNWTPVLTIIGDGTQRSLTDTNAAGSQRFYRVRRDN